MAQRGEGFGESKTRWAGMGYKGARGGRPEEVEEEGSIVETHDGELSLRFW